MRDEAGKLGDYPILAVLPDKFARFLFEFHDFRFASLDLPHLPADRIDFDVYGALENEQVQKAVKQRYMHVHNGGCQAS